MHFGTRTFVWCIVANKNEYLVQAVLHHLRHSASQAVGFGIGFGVKAMHVDIGGAYRKDIADLALPVPAEQARTKDPALGLRSVRGTLNPTRAPDR